MEFQRISELLRGFYEASRGFEGVCGGVGRVVSSDISRDLIGFYGTILYVKEVLGYCRDVSRMFQEVLRDC